MKIESLIRIIAGTVVVTGSILTWFVSPAWVLLTAFAGFNLFQSAFTGFCLPSLVLGKLGWIDADGTIRWGGKGR